MVSHNTGINIFVNTVGGKWKGLILYFLSQQSIRTKDFYPLIPGITQKVLTDQLKQLERDGLVQRELFPEVPPRVEYSLTDLGQSFVPILNIMCEWGNTYALARDIEKDGQIRCSHEEKKA